MKRIDLHNWEQNGFSSRLLLFVQTIADAAFSYSYESYRFPALNIHAFGYEVFQTACDIESKVLMDGSFIPIAEEFESFIKEDPFIKNSMTDGDLLLYAKDKNMGFYDLTKLELKTKIKAYKEVANYIIDKCEVNDSYLNFIRYSILNSIFEEEDSNSARETIYSFSRMFVTELVNTGYSQEFIYDTTMHFFFTSSKPIMCNQKTVIDYFNRFVCQENTFQFKFRVNAKLLAIFDNLDNYEIGVLSPEERVKLNCQRKNAKCVIFRVKDLDYYSAYRKALNSINTVLSIHNLNQHDSRLYFSLYAIVSKIEDNKTHEFGFIVNESVNIMKKKGNSSYLHALYNDVFLHNSGELPATVIRAVNLHNVAIECKDATNQLLNLWTIIEVLISTKRDNEDRINTICCALSQVLNRDYLYSNIEQLLKDIECCITCNMEEVLQSVGVSDLDRVEKMCLVLSLEQYKAERDFVLTKLVDYPLLQFRICFFSEKVFKDSESIYNYLFRHTKRIQWHIMRIYRNRNMIVHDNSCMPYINQIVENLHFYVDTLISTLIEYSIMGYSDVTNIYKEIGFAESCYYERLGAPIKNKKERFKPILLTEDNALDLIFNGYSGNRYKKALDSIIMDKEEEE